MILPLWVGRERPHALSIWPLLLLIGANIAVYYYFANLEQTQPGITEQWWEYVGAEGLNFRHLVLSSFAHADIWHLLTNMWFLWLFGGLLAGGLRARYFYALYFAAVMFGTLMQDLLSEGGGIGASGGVAGLMGFFLTHFIRQPVICLLFFFPISLPAWLLVFFFIGNDIYLVFVGSDYVAYWAHLGGFVVGILAGGMIKRIDEHRLRR